MLPVSSWLFWQRADGNNQLRRQNFRPRAFSNLSGPLSITFVRRGFQVVLARNFLFALFISVIPALMPVVGLKELHLSLSNLGLLFTSMGSWIGCRSSVYHSVAESSLLARLSHPLGKFAACLRLRVNGARSPARGVFCCCGACRGRMDNVGFRTLGGGAARDAKLGPRPHERHSDHHLAGGDGP